MKYFKNFYENGFIRLFWILYCSAQQNKTQTTDSSCKTCEQANSWNDFLCGSIQTSKVTR